MVHQYIDHIVRDPVLLALAILMGLLFLVDLGLLVGRRLTVYRGRLISFSGIIVSAGLFSTFLGILAGLYSFDTENIARSVPQLLDGLRFAFAGSVLGLFLSLILSILHKLLGSEDGNEDVLQSINDKLTALVAAVQAPNQIVRQFAELKDFLRNQLGQINVSLERALEQLAQGATKEVTLALQEIIREFNENLTTQFGDNFKELNAACHELVIWQRNYREHVDRTEGTLRSVLASLNQSVEAATVITAQNEATQETCREVARLTKTYDIQIRTLETHLASCKALGAEAKKLLTTTEGAIQKSMDHINSFSGAIGDSVVKQSETLARLTKELDHQLPKALGELESVLTELTQQFAADYRSLFQFVTKQQ